MMRLCDLSIVLTERMNMKTTFIEILLSGNNDKFTFSLARSG